jgi:hypothetical protein
LELFHPNHCPLLSFSGTSISSFNPNSHSQPTSPSTHWWEKRWLNSLCTLVAISHHFSRLASCPHSGMEIPGLAQITQTQSCRVSEFRLVAYDTALTGRWATTYSYCISISFLSSDQTAIPWRQLPCFTHLSKGQCAKHEAITS